MDPLVINKISHVLNSEDVEREQKRELNDPKILTVLVASKSFSVEWKSYFWVPIQFHLIDVHFNWQNVLHIRRLHLQHNAEFLRKKLCPWGLW